jgi:hypothetical protein
MVVRPFYLIGCSGSKGRKADGFQKSGEKYGEE